VRPDQLDVAIRALPEAVRVGTVVPAATDGPRVAFI
jgi:hypothetical protein